MPRAQLPSAAVGGLKNRIATMEQTFNDDGYAGERVREEFHYRPERHVTRKFLGSNNLFIYIYTNY